MSPRIRLLFAVIWAMGLDLICSLVPTTSTHHPRRRASSPWVGSILSRRTFPLHSLQAKAPSSKKIPKKNEEQTQKEAELPIDGSEKIQFQLELARERIGKGEQLKQPYCDSLLAQCVAEDEWDLVLDVLDIMKTQGISQVHSTYRACLLACNDASNAASADEILNAMKQAQISPTPDDIGIVIATMCEQQNRAKWWRRALALAKQNDDLPLVAYEDVLRSLDEYQWKEAVLLMRQMEQGTTKPDLYTYELVMECCACAQQSEQAVQVLQSCIRADLKPSIRSLELVISALSKKMQWRRAMQLLDLMEDLGIPKTVSCYNSVLAALSRAKEVVQAKNLLVKMRKSGIQPNIISYNTVLAAAASTSRWKDALSVLDQCHREPGVSPDIYTYTNAIRACAKGGMTRRALTLLEVVKDKRLPIDTYCYTAAIEACAKAKMWVKALELLDEMEDKGIAPSEVTYSVTITACGNAGQWEKALNLLDLMRTKGMSINLITYNAAITAVSKAAKQISKSHSDMEVPELWKTVMGLLEQMRKDGVEPDGFSYSSAIACCAAEGRWKEALELLETMEKGGPRTRPNKIAYSAAISSCGKSGQVDQAFLLFSKMKDQGIAADRVAYNALFSALRVSKKADMAYELWNEMVGKKPTNTTSIATARYESTRPDIITITNAIAAMSSDTDTKGDRDRVDEIFSEAVGRGIILRSHDTLDSTWEFDLSGMSLHVARAACRYILLRIARSHKDGEGVENLTLITGTGRGHKDEKHTSLQEYVRQVLERDFDPPLQSLIPKRAVGTVEIDRDSIIAWAESLPATS